MLPPLPLPDEMRLQVAHFLEDEIQLVKKKLFAALQKYFTTPQYETSDIDIFVSRYSHSSGEQHELSTAELVNQVAKQLENVCDEYESLGHDSPSYDYERKYLYVRSQAALSFCAVRPRRNIQIIDCGDRLPEDALIDFDIDCTTVAYDGEEVYTLPRGKQAITTKCNFMDPFVLRFRRTRNRVAKYFDRGYSILLFEHCVHTPRCDVVLDERARGLWKQTKGNLFVSIEIPNAPNLDTLNPQKH